VLRVVIFSFCLFFELFCLGLRKQGRRSVPEAGHGSPFDHLQGKIKKYFQGKYTFSHTRRHSVTTFVADSSAVPLEFSLLLHTTLVQFPFHQSQSRLVHLLGRVGRPQPAEILSLVQVLNLHALPLYWRSWPRISDANFSAQAIRDIPCPNRVTKRRFRESTQPP
jgi:hypothetical protein